MLYLALMKKSFNNILSSKHKAIYHPETILFDKHALTRHIVYSILKYGEKFFKWHYEYVFVNYKLFEGINAYMSNSKSENSMAHINTG